MRCLVFSDIHGNLEALDAVLDHAKQIEQYWCLGDIVGYGPNPNECVERIGALSPLVCLAGNHDRIASEKLDMRAYGRFAHQNAVWTQEQLTPRNTQFLGELLEQSTVGQFTLVHGGIHDPLWEYVNTSLVAQACLENCTTSYCLVGHTHVPRLFLQHEDKCGSQEIVWKEQPFNIKQKRAILNPGSVGLSHLNDGHVYYVVLNTETLEVDFRRISYAVETTRTKLEHMGILIDWLALNRRFTRHC